MPLHLKEKQVRSILDTYRRGDYRDMLKSECFLRRYDRNFAEIQTDAPIIVELGVHSGGSLRLWTDTFPGATIIGFDAKVPPGISRRVVHWCKGRRESVLTWKEY